MRIWLVTVGEPWPTDGDTPRMHRTGINAAFLASRGHEVVSWSGTFDHASKTERTGRDTDTITAQGYRLIGIHSGTYERNVSLKRIRYHRAVTARFCEMAPQLEKPDVIVVSLTPLELARAAVEYGARINVPVVVDVRDLWPDIWAEQLPQPLQPFKKILLAPFYNDLRNAVRGATAMIGITESAVDWALASGSRKRSELDRSYPLVYTTEVPAESKISEAEKYWRSIGIFRREGEMIGCFFGTFSTRVDFETPLRAITEMPASLQPRIKLVLCGRGENEALIREYAAKTPQIVCHPWVQAPEIVALMRMSSFGLLPYRPTLDFVRSLPNKVFEYLSAGLPIVTSLRGEIERLFEQFSCGLLYQSGEPSTFRTLIEELSGSPDQRTAVARRAQAAGAAYDSASICEAFEGYLQRVAKLRGYGE